MGSWQLDGVGIRLEWRWHSRCAHFPTQKSVSERKAKRLRDAKIGEPLAPSNIVFQSDCRSSKSQSPVAGFPRRRKCLLKGCGNWFRPELPLARYCGHPCRAAARRWTRWWAAWRYRRTEHGRQCRREQCRRRRERLRQRRNEALSEPDSPRQAEPPACEGHHKDADRKKIPCRRPGCYRRFTVSRRSPHQRFCNGFCRKALRRVIQREQRWLNRWRRILEPLSSLVQRTSGSRQIKRPVL